MKLTCIESLVMTHHIPDDFRNFNLKFNFSKKNENLWNFRNESPHRNFVLRWDSDLRVFLSCYEPFHICFQEFIGMLSKLEIQKSILQRNW